MPEPVFGAEDRVATTQLPAELKGVTDPLKIAAYYQQREGQLREEMRRTLPPNKESTRVVIEQRTDDQQRPPQATFSVAEAEAARATLIEAARSTARQGKPYWDRLSNDIEELMKPLGPEDKVNVKIWETCYHTLVGMNKDKLDNEDKTRATEAARISAERSSAAASEGQAPPPLPIEVTSKVLPGLNISEQQYRESQDRISKGVWPLTAENVSGRRVLIGGEK